MDRALLIGINAYPTQPLNGCVNDVQDMAAFITAKCSFDPANVRLLTDARATADAIRERIAWLLTGLSAGDRILLHYSGHGTQMPLRNAQGIVDQEEDVICPVDFDWTEGHAISASEFQRDFQGVPPGVEFIFLSDSCYSGDLVRALQPGMPKYLRPPADIAWRHVAAVKNKITRKSIGAAVTGNTNCGFISGCGPAEESADTVFAGKPNGAFTYYLLQALSGTGLGLSLTGLVPVVVNSLHQGGYSQTPELHGSTKIEAAAFLSQQLIKGIAATRQAAPKNFARKKT